MAVAPPPTAILAKLKSDVEIDAPSHADAITLTPPLVLAISLLYMMACDGSIEDEESSQLQATLGGHESLLQFALRYVQDVPVEEFLQKAPEVLSAQDTLCILANVCDSMLSDGRSEPTELALFDQILDAFGWRKAAFDIYFKTLALKNDKTVLGPFEPLKTAPFEMTPHLALAASLLYMMTSDGSIGAEEIGQLEVVIGEFAGLQQVALRYVRAIKRSEFLRVAAPLLSERQKLFILTNVCDSMLSDGSVAKLEDKLFVSMLSAFGYSESTFQTYYQVIETKNIKSFDTSKFKLSTQHTRLMSGDAQDGEVFDKVLADAKSLQGLHTTAATQVPPPEREAQVAQANMGSVIHRTMQDNITTVKQDFGGQEDVVKVGRNATEQLNVQKVDTGADAANVQKLATDVRPGDNLQPVNHGPPIDDNRQTVASAPTPANRQNIDAELYSTYGSPVGKEGLSDNIQGLSQEGIQSNLQPISSTLPSAHRALLAAPDDQDDNAQALSPEVRMQNLFEDIDVLNRKLDVFEEKNKKILEMARQAKEENRRREAQALAAALNRQSVQEAVAQPNVQPVEKESVSINLQEVAIERVLGNQQNAPEKVATAFVRWDANTAAPNAVPTPTASDTPNTLESQKPLAAQPAEQIWIGAKPALSDSLLSTTPWADAAEDSLLSAPKLASVGKRASKRSKLAGRQGQAADGKGVPFKVYVKATVTFVVLSCWASSISAVDTVRTKRFVGVLERAPLVTLIQVPLQMQE